MPRASTVVKLVLLGSAVGLIGWGIYSLWDYPWSGGSGHHGGGWYYGSHGWFYGGGGTSGSSGPAQGGSVARGGFGAYGAVGGGE
jgi:hypothetical protein